MQVQDFCGFTFNGVHSSELGIIRTSDGNRYNDTMIPSFQKDTVKIPGNDGTLAWDSFYTQKDFQIKIAYDNLSEKNRRKFRQLFSAKQRGWLIFDEEPYKKYEVEIKDPPQLTELCFDEEIHIPPEYMTYEKLYGQYPRPTYGRIYKGEGTINFVCYAGYAQNVWTFVDDIPVDKWRNTSEWIGASGLQWKEIRKNKPEWGQGVEYYTKANQQQPQYWCYNPGDREADWTCTLWKGNKNTPIYIQLQVERNIDGEVKWVDSGKNLVIKSDAMETGTYVFYNSRKHLLEQKSIQTGKTTGLLNKHIESGDFFTIPQEDSRLVFSSSGQKDEYGLKPDMEVFENPVPIFYYY